MEDNDSLQFGIICQMCYKPFNDPRMLPCLHSFCFQCICSFPILCDMRPGNVLHENIRCPTCLTSVSIPMGGVNVFPSNHHLGFEVDIAGYMSKFGSDCAVSCTFCVNSCGNHADKFCCNCCKFLCRIAQDCHRHVSHLSNHNVIELDKDSAKLLSAITDSTEHYCSQTKHESKELDLYCNSCCNLICSKCVILLHKDHNITPLSIIAESHRDEMKDALQYFHQIMPTLAGAIDANEKMIHQIETSKQEAEVAIEDTFNKLVETLEERKKALLSELNSISLSMVTSLTIQKEQFEKIQQNIEHSTQVASHILHTHTDHEVVALRGLVPIELKAILKKIENVSFIPNQRSYFKFSGAQTIDGNQCCSKLQRYSMLSTDEMLKQIPNVGTIVNLSPSPQHSVCTFTSIATWINMKYCIKLQTMSSNKKSYPCGGLQIKAELQSTLHDAVVSGVVEDHKDGTYTITLTPQITGPHQLRITMDGLHVVKSPFDLRVRGDYTSLCSPHQVIYVNKPYCVAVGNYIYVGSDDQLSMLDESGHLIENIGCKGSCSGQYNCPFGICIKYDVMFIADSGNHRIQKLDTTGKFLDQFGEKGSSQEQLNGPYNVVIDSRNRVIVSDSKNNRIQIIENGSWLLNKCCHSILTIDGSRFGDENFEDPRGIALDFKENIHVAAYGSNAIKVFTPEGTYIRMYGELNGPIGIAIDEQGYCFVSEERGNCLSIFDPKGYKVHTIENLCTPQGIALDQSGSVYISNLGNGTIYRYIL